MSHGRRGAPSWLESATPPFGSKFVKSIPVADKCQKDISQIFRERPLIDEALNAAVREAVLRHKQLGLPVVVWRDGKSVWIPPEEIPSPDGPRK